MKIFKTFIDFIRHYSECWRGENKKCQEFEDKHGNLIFIGLAGIPALICGVLAVIFCIFAIIDIVQRFTSEGLAQIEKNAPAAAEPFLCLLMFLGPIVYLFLPVAAFTVVFGTLFLVCHIVICFIHAVKGIRSKEGE